MASNGSSGKKLAKLAAALAVLLYLLTVNGACATCTGDYTRCLSGGWCVNGACAMCVDLVNQGQVWFDGYSNYCPDMYSVPSGCPLPSSWDTCTCGKPSVRRVYTSVCADQTTFHKFYCNGDILAAESYTCPSGYCSGVACVASVNGACYTIPHCAAGCAVGDLQGFSQTSTQYLWNCLGSYGGTTAHCVLDKTVNGACGTTNNACTTGTLSDIADSTTQYLWNCVGTYCVYGGYYNLQFPGTTASCSLPKPVNGVCGTTNNACTAGTWSDIADSTTQYLWKCVGTNGGTTASCSLPKPVITGACGTANGHVYLATDPQSWGSYSLCTTPGGTNPSSPSPPQQGSFTTWTCLGSNGGSPSPTCTASRALCGNGRIESGEQCDDGNTAPGDGCSSACTVESGWTCTGQPSFCTRNCGNGIKDPGEQCDDGNTIAGDGCSNTTCFIECSYLTATSWTKCVDGWQVADVTVKSYKPNVRPGDLDCKDDVLFRQCQCEPGEECDTGGDDCSAPAACPVDCPSGTCQASGAGCACVLDCSASSACPVDCPSGICQASVTGCVCVLDCSAPSACSGGCSFGQECREVSETCTCVNSPCEYMGHFNSVSWTSDFEILLVNFTDESTGGCGDPIGWTFTSLPVSGQDCLGGTPVFSANDQTVPKGHEVPIGTLTLETTPDGGVCSAVIQATDPDGVTTVGVYTITSYEQPLCPTCQVIEIPAIIHPIGMYSTSLSDAQKAYTSASAAVNSLSAKCTPTCSASAGAKLTEANTNLNAAQLYLSPCVDGSSLCRLSQYYSVMAQELAREGMLV